MSRRKPNGSQARSAARGNGKAPAKAKPERQEKQVAAIGDNRPLDAKTFFEHLREIESAERRKDSAVASLRNSYKRAEEAGINTKKLKEARKLREYTEPELALEFNTLIAYAKHLRVPVYGDLSTVKVNSPTEDAVLAQARNKGLVAGRIGESSDKNPWTLDTPAGREWASARDQGEKEFKTGFAV